MQFCWLQVKFCSKQLKLSVFAYYHADMFSPPGQSNFEANILGSASKQLPRPRPWA